MADAGKIMFTLKGDYDETVSYEILDVVTYDSSLYVSRINNNLGYAPSDTEKWQLLIQKSDVVGVKGDAEADYRTGLVNITPKDIGLGDLKYVAFSGDYNDLDNIPKDWEDNTLNTLAEIEAATEENLIAGALAVKELSTEVETIQTNEKAQILTFTSKSIATSAWASSTTYADYPYRATVSCSGVTTNHIPHVAFRVAQADSGNFASVAESTSNGVYVYAKEKPTATIYVTVQAIKSIT